MKKNTFTITKEQVNSEDIHQNFCEDVEQDISKKKIQKKNSLFSLKEEIDEDIGLDEEEEENEEYEPGIEKKDTFKQI